MLYLVELYISTKQENTMLNKLGRQSMCHLHEFEILNIPIDLQSSGPSLFVKVPVEGFLVHKSVFYKYIIKLQTKDHVYTDMFCDENI